MRPPLAARLDARVFSRTELAKHPTLEISSPEFPALARRGFLAAAGAALFCASALAAEGPLVFSPADLDTHTKGADAPMAGVADAKKPLAKGEIPSDFWERPRELWLRRHLSKEEVRVVYWKDGKLQSDGYWRACALLRDRHANVMTAIDPTLLDVLCGINGYYRSWQWKHPIVITSGYRSEKTNAALKSEGAAKNSMHLYGKAVDLYIPGIPPEHIGKLGQYLRQGGVGFYPSRGFTHLDTGRLRSWKG